MKNPKFTFKTERPIGRYRSFYPDSIYIKFKGIRCGRIQERFPYKISFQIIKKDINEDKNPNCPWKWITLKKESQSLQEAKEWLNQNIQQILERYELNLNP